MSFFFSGFCLCFLGFQSFHLSLFDVVAFVFLENCFDRLSDEISGSSDQQFNKIDVLCNR